MARTDAADVLFNPVVWKDHIQAYFDQLLVWGASSVRFDDLIQAPGETLTWPYFKSISAVEEPTEAGSLTVDKLGDDSFSSSVKEVGKAVGFSDKSLIVSGASKERIFGEAQRQIARRLAEKVDQDIVTEVSTVGNFVAGYTGTVVGDTMNMSRLMQGKIGGFGDRQLESAVCYMHSKQFSDLLRDTTAGFLKADATDMFAMVNGYLGRLGGMGVIVSDLCPVTVDGISVGVNSYDAFIMKPNAHGLILKKDFGDFESDRDILKRETVVSMTTWYSNKAFHAKVAADDLRINRIRTAAS